mmetsp:Transcript_19509/g.45441  ORF Transcript_19509/g.45441 Transcript_19509/m.45441 type:complete len:816 (+) Transcript_19509:488-2935(+)
MFLRKSAFVLLSLAFISSVASGYELSDAVEGERDLAFIDIPGSGGYGITNCTCKSDCDSHESGDPHFRTWSNEYYDFQSSCDMIHVRNSLLDLHIRTKYRGGFSAVSKLALRFTTDIMEMADDGSLALNGAPATAPFNLDGIYPVTSVVTGYGTEVTVLMSGGQSMLLTSRGRGGINIWIDAHGSDFCDSQGMAGQWTQSGFLQRDGINPVSPISPGLNKIEYGVEWEVDVLLGDPILFSTAATDNCIDPPVCDPLDPYFVTCYRRQRERKLQPLDPFVECSSFCVNPSDVNNCVFDWNVAGEAMARNNPVYTQVWQPTQRCIATSDECEARGGECVYRCNPKEDLCLEGLCGSLTDLEVLEQPDPDAPYIEGCSCAVPKSTPSTPSPAPPPTPVPTPCPPPIISNPAIAGYLPRTDAGGCLEWDLIQKEFEEIMGDESCASLELGEVYYDTGPGTYFQTIPNFNSPESTVYREYTKYYGKSNFVQNWVEKAFKMTQTNFLRGNAKFGDAFPSNTAGSGECVGFEEVIKKGTAYTGQLVNSYQLVQRAIEEVNGGCYAQANGCTAAIEAIDCAVAAYVGSLEGVDGNNDPSGDYGKGPYALGDKRCRNFRTCGPTRDKDDKDLTAAVNTQVLSLFGGASHAAWVGDAGLIEAYLRLISNKSIIPFVQGVFRYYYYLSDKESGPGTFSVLDKYVGEGGAFMFGALPKLWACSSRGAKKAEEQTKIGGGIAGVSAVDWDAVRLSFECNYRCLGITCTEVGSFYNGDASVKPGGEACNDEENGSENVCDKLQKKRKTECKLFTGKPGIKDRDKLRFTI